MPPSTPTRPGRIRVALTEGGGEALVAVEDEGDGIPADLLPRIFDLFVQGDHTLARSQGGLGIGLTLVRRLIEMHGGEVAVESRGVGHGSQFTIRLPALATPARPLPLKTRRCLWRGPLRAEC